MGRAAAQIFAREGGAIAVLDLNSDSAHATAQSIRDAGGTAFPIQCDVSDPASIEAAIAEAARSLGGVDVCWANAGTGDHGGVVDTPLEHWDMVLRINLTGMFLTAKHVIPHMLEAGGGSLMFTSSTGVLGWTPNVVSNMAAKGGVLGLVREINAEYIAREIRVNAICPGSTRTYAMTSSMESRDVKEGKPIGTNMAAFEAKHPRGRIAEPEELANVALFLASDESMWVSGNFIYVNGLGV
jgi:NAD(P)-dependent dehydrogenase (short-subunit alcohol dehydrogenase family)